MVKMLNVYLSRLALWRTVEEIPEGPQWIIHTRIDGDVGPIFSIAG